MCIYVHTHMCTNNTHTYTYTYMYTYTDTCIHIYIYLYEFAQDKYFHTYILYHLTDTCLLLYVGNRALFLAKAALYISSKPRLFGKNSHIPRKRALCLGKRALYLGKTFGATLLTRTCVGDHSLLYCTLENAFYVRPSDDQRTVLGIAAAMAPFKCCVTGLSSNSQFSATVSQVQWNHL